MANKSSARRTFELLWGLREQPTRGPKPSLSVEQIVRVAIEIADAEGLGAVSMRRVAERLGVTTMSLYRYVPSKNDLLELMLDAIASPWPDPAEMPDNWRDALHLWAHRNMAVYREHPWLIEYAFSHPPFGPNNIRWMEYAAGHASHRPVAGRHDGRTDHLDWIRPQRSLARVRSPARRPYDRR